MWNLLVYFFRFICFFAFVLLSGGVVFDCASYNVWVYGCLSTKWELGPMVKV